MQIVKATKFDGVTCVQYYGNEKVQPIQAKNDSHVKNKIEIWKIWKSLTLKHAMFLTFEMGQIQQIECMVKWKPWSTKYNQWIVCIDALNSTKLHDKRAGRSVAT